MSTPHSRPTARRAVRRTRSLRLLPLMLTAIAVLALGLLLLATHATVVLAQRPMRGGSLAAVDSTSPRCLDVGWLDARASCEGRAMNAAALTLAGASTGAVAGLIGGAIAPTACLGGADANARRGAIAGAVLGATVGLATRHVSRRVRAERDARARAAAQGASSPSPWRTISPVAIALGTVAAAGAVIGAVEGGRHDERCSGIGGGAATGTAVYAASGATTLVGSLLIVRFLF